MSHDGARQSRSQRIFSPRTRYRDPRNERIYALYELVHTGVDFAAGVLFVVGSVLFFSDELHTSATWCFLCGSVLFVAKPSIRLARELAYYREGELETVIERDNE